MCMSSTQRRPSMNIFVLDQNPLLAAQYQHDKHVVKMVLETTQLLSTSFIQLGVSKPWMYRVTHVNHPCAVWARAHGTNLWWLVAHGLALAEEYEYRYGKVHACHRILDCFRRSMHLLPLPFATGYTGSRCTQRPQCMPDRYRTRNAVSAYRAYYAAEKAPGQWYTRRNPPRWLWQYMQAQS